jgi:biopolymer transport protein ExbD
MALTLAGSRAEPFSEMNTTPLIDVMLVLLIMFIITIPVMTHAVKLDLPQVRPDSPPLTPPQVIDLEIDSDGAIVWNGTVVPSLQSLEAYFRAESGREPQPEIHLRPDRRARYDVVAVVLASAQRNHMKRIGFVNTSGFQD